MPRTPRAPASSATATAPAGPVTPPPPPAAAAARGAAAAGAGAPPAAPTKAPATKEIVDLASFTEKWSTPAKITKVDFEVEIGCNRPSCDSTLVHFVPPGTSSKSGVTFAVCKSGSCAGGGTILKFDSKCFSCHGTIPAGTVCLSIKTGDKKFTNQHLRNCLLDKLQGTENAAFACTAAAKDIGKTCTTCVEIDPVINKGDILLSSAPLGTRLHYSCARKKRKDFLRIVFNHQDDRHASYLKKEEQSADKKTKIEAAVSFSALAADSDDDL